MTEKQADKLVQLIFRAAPPFRKNYIRQPEQAKHLPRLSHHQLFCLINLNGSGGQTMSALAERMGVSVQQLTRIVGELTESGLAMRTPSEENRRTIFVSITDKGREMLLHYYRAACKRMRERFSSMDERDVDALLYHLEEAVGLLDKLQV